MNKLSRFFAMHPRVELKEFYVYSVLFSLASALIAIFEPVFFYQQGIRLWVIALYYVLHYLLYYFTLPLGGMFANRFGLERSLSLSIPVFVIYFLILAAMPQIPELFWLAWLVLAVFKILYWPAYHAELVKFGDISNMGTELSWLFAVINGGGIIGPLIGGVVAAVFGFSTLFVAAAGIALLAAIPLLRTKEIIESGDFRYVHPWKVLRMKRNSRTRLAMWGWGENLIDVVYWPILMFIVLGGVAELGLVVSLNILLMTLVGFFIGEVSDRIPRRRIIRLHIPFMVLGFLLRGIASTPWRALLTDSLSKVSGVGLRLPMWHLLYSQAKRQGPLQYMVAMEMELALAKAVTAGILVGVFAVSVPMVGFTLSFILAAGLTMLYILL